MMEALAGSGPPATSRMTPTFSAIARLRVHPLARSAVLAWIGVGCAASDPATSAAERRAREPSPSSTPAEVETPAATNCPEVARPSPSATTEVQVEVEVDLCDDWAPRVLSPPDVTPPAYRAVYVALANERWHAPGVPTVAHNDRYFELFGIPSQPLGGGGASRRSPAACVSRHRGRPGPRRDVDRAGARRPYPRAPAHPGARHGGAGGRGPPGVRWTAGPAPGRRGVRRRHLERPGAVSAPPRDRRGGPSGRGHPRGPARGQPRARDPRGPADAARAGGGRDGSARRRLGLQRMAAGPRASARPGAAAGSPRSGPDPRGGTGFGSGPRPRRPHEPWGGRPRRRSRRRWPGSARRAGCRCPCPPRRRGGASPTPYGWRSIAATYGPSPRGTRRASAAISRSTSPRP